MTHTTVLGNVIHLWLAIIIRCHHVIFITYQTLINKLSSTILCLVS